MLPSESAIAAAERALFEMSGLAPRSVYSADYVNQIFDHARDAIVLIPVFAFGRAPTPPFNSVLISSLLNGVSETKPLLVCSWSGQRWSIRHIDDVIGGGAPTSEFYRIR